MVSRQAVLTECAVWANWCYGHHPFLWHPLGCLTSELDVQQGDPLDPLLFSLVLNILVSAISTRDDCAGLNFHAWYMDDGALAGPRSSVMNVLALLQELGPPLSLHVNIRKCEVFSQSSLDIFPAGTKSPKIKTLKYRVLPLEMLIFATSLLATNGLKPKTSCQSLRMLAWWIHRLH